VSLSVQEKTKARGPNRNTPMAIYNDLMKEAGRKPMDMYTPAADADSNDESDGESEDKVLAGSAPSVASTRSRKRGAVDDDDDDDDAAAAFTTPHPTPGDARRGRGAAGKEPVAPIKQKTVAQLKGELAAMGLSTSGNKMVLKDRLSEVSHCVASLLTCSVRNALTFLYVFLCVECEFVRMARVGVMGLDFSFHFVFTAPCDSTCSQSTHTANPPLCPGH
jgi:hypothetical protein